MPEKKTAAGQQESPQVAQKPEPIPYLIERGYDVTGYLTDDDIEAFRSVVSRMPNHFRMVELGSLYGASAMVFTLLAKEMGKTCDILCIDTFSSPIYGNEKLFIENTKEFDNIHHIKEYFIADSFEYDGSSIDLYFDDASHLAPLTYSQVVYWSKYAKNIMVHDYIETFPGVINAVNRFASERNITIERFTKSSVVYMEIV